MVYPQECERLCLRIGNKMLVERATCSLSRTSWQHVLQLLNLLIPRGRAYVASYLRPVSSLDVINERTKAWTTALWRARKGVQILPRCGDVARE